MKRRLTPVVFICTAFLLLIVVGGCAGVSKKPESVTAFEGGNHFENRLYRLVEDLVDAEAHTPGEIAPVAVMPGSLKSGTPFSRLEEMVMERLAMRLRKDHNLTPLSRQNWFEFREGRPLSFSEQGTAQQRLLRNLVVYEVGISPDDILKQVKVHITASDSEGHAIHGVVAQTTLDFGKGSVARAFYSAKPHSNPFPEGSEERPYASLDRLTFSLASELADAYRNGAMAGKQIAADEEVKVLLYSKPPSAGVGNGQIRAIQDALQQAVIRNAGFTCVLSQEDFGSAFDQIDSYSNNARVFEMEESLFAAGTVLLMAEAFGHPDGNKIGVALRAIWRTGPLETSSGDLIHTNMAGTYLSGFAAKAYMYGNSLRAQYEAKAPRRTVQEVIYSTKKEPDTQSQTPIRKKKRIDHSPIPLLDKDLDVCFYEFTEVLERRIYPTLRNAPGVTGFRRADKLCDRNKGCVCYTLRYEGSSEELTAWLRHHLRTSQVLAFRIVPKNEGRLDLYFDGGFK